MRAGRLRRRVRIEALTRTPDGYGAQEETWRLVATVWAAVTYRGGTERVQSLLLQAEADLAVTIRCRGDVTPGHRCVTDRNEVLDVVSVLPDERRTELLLMCKYRVV